MGSIFRVHKFTASGTLTVSRAGRVVRHVTTGEEIFGISALPIPEGEVVFLPVGGHTVTVNEGETVWYRYAQRNADAEVSVVLPNCGGLADQEMDIMWWSDSATNNSILYRVAGSSDAWQTALSARTEELPSRAGWYVHTAPITADPEDQIEIFEPRSGYREIVQFPPSENVKPLFGSDIQGPYTYDDASTFGQFGALVASQDRHVFLCGGDVVDDNGRSDATRVNRWERLLRLFARRYRRANGCLIPMAIVPGNHEAEDPENPGTTNWTGGNGIVGPLPIVQSCGYRSGNTATGPYPGCMSMRFGNELAVVGFDTDQISSLADQLPWVKGQIAAAYPLVRHIILIYHAPAFRGNVASRDYESQGHLLRTDLFPWLDQYADKARFGACGHNHHCMDTGPKVVNWDPQDSWQSSRSAFSTVAEGLGIRELRICPMHASNTDSPSEDMAGLVGTDDSIAAAGGAYGWNSALSEPVTFGTINDPVEEFFSVGIMDFSAAGWNVKYMRTDETVMYEVGQVLE